MPQRPPPLNRLRAFEAVARHGSVTRAAVELGVSQPAVTQQLRQLEALVEVPLVRRVAGGIAVTAEGQAYAARLQRAFAEIEAATADLRSVASQNRVLTLSVLATFAQRWLIPRLAGFQAAHPDLEVRLLTTSRLVDLDRDDVDLSIRSGNGRWPRCRSDFLIENRVFPVASPALTLRQPLHAPADLVGHVLIQVEAEPRQHDWHRWLSAAGVAGLEPRSWLTFSSSAHALEAALAGLGVATAHTPFVVDGLRANRLAAPFALEIADDDYFLVSASERGEIRKIRLFRDWLLGEAR
jgi:LysR family glycine cleavage system transcriptional activator